MTITAALLICVVIAVSMPKVQDYRRELDNINYRLSMIAESLTRIAERLGKSDGQTD